MDFSQVKVIAVIVTYNGSNLIVRCLQSLQASSVKVDTIVIDNASTDNTVELIQHFFPEVFIIKNTKNLGFGQANNIGIQYGLNSKADYFFLINQDAWVATNTIETLIRFNIQHPDFCVLSPLHLESNGRQLEYFFSTYLQNAKILEQYLLLQEKKNEIYEVPFVNAALWLVPAKYFLLIGGFDPLFFHYGEDNDFINRVYYHDLKVGVCFDAIGYHERNKRVTSNSLHRPARSIMVKSYLISLKNINQHILICLFQVVFNFSWQVAKYLLKFDVKGLSIECSAFIEVFKKLNLIVQHRKISMRDKMAFLK